jgi:hypothetical protein
MPDKDAPCHGRLTGLAAGRGQPKILQWAIVNFDDWAAIASGFSDNYASEARLKCRTWCVKMAVRFGTATMVLPLPKKATLRSCDGQR